MLSTTAGASAQSGEVPEGSVSWLSTGDSYSSGEGVFGNEGDCAQTRNAWGPLTADKLRPMGWTIGPEAFTACTGLLVEHFFNASDKAASLFEWGLEQGVPARTDIITLSFGGNDIGFPDLIKDCLDQDSWFVIWSGCDFSEVDVQERINALLDPPLTDCVGGRVINLVDADPYLCDLWIGPDLANRGSYIDFLVQLAENHLTDRGRIYLAGYPAIVAPNSEWDSWNVYACAGILQGDAEHLGRIATYFDTSLRIAVGQANRELGEERIVYVSRLDLFRDGSHELCGTGGEWLNGISNNRDQTGSMRWEGSFHPNAKGHIGTADYLTQIINLPAAPAAVAPTWEELKNASLPGLCSHPPTVLVDGIDPNADPGFLALDRDSLTRPVPSDVGPLTALIANCSAGGVGWPSLLMFFGAGGEYVASSLLLEEADWASAGLDGPARSGIQRLEVTPTGVLVDTSASLPWDFACCASGTARLEVFVTSDGVFVSSIVSNVLPWLRVDGFGDYDFGRTTDNVVAVIEPLVGSPSNRSDVDCGGGTATILTFDGFSLVSVEGRLVGWTYQGSDPPMTTPSGISPGIPRSSLEDRYQGVLIEETTLGTEFFYETPSGYMGGFFSGISLSALHAGFTCFFR